MNKIILILLLIIFIPGKFIAQEKNTSVKFGAGLFVDLTNVNLNIYNKTLLTGPNYFVEVGYKLKSNVILSANYSYSFIKSTLNNNIIEQAKRNNYTISTGYEFSIGKSIRLVPQAGLSYYHYYSVQNHSYGGQPTEYIESDLAFNINFDGYYLYNKNFMLGLRIGGYYLYNYSWVEGIWVTPIVGIKF